MIIWLIIYTWFRRNEIIFNERFDPLDIIHYHIFTYGIKSFENNEVWLDFSDITRNSGDKIIGLYQTIPTIYIYGCKWLLHVE